MKAPRLCPDELQQEWVPAGTVDHDLQCVVADASAGRLDGLAEGTFDVGWPNGAQSVALGAA